MAPTTKGHPRREDTVVSLRSRVGSYSKSRTNRRPFTLKAVKDKWLIW